MEKIIQKVLLHSSGVFGLNSDDVLLASYPRSGNTWVRFFFCHLISLKEWDGKEVDFEILNRTMPEFGVNNLLKTWPHETIPRIVKTHKKCWPIFRNRHSILIVRDPRDVMVSYYHYKKDRKGEFTGEFEEFIRSRTYGLKNWFEHYDSWQEHANLVVKYEDMKKDDVREFTRIINFLEVSVEQDLIEKVVERASIESVSTAEEKNNEVSKMVSKNPDAKFTRDGSTKQWKEYFSDEDLDYYKKLKEQFEFEIY